MPNLIQDQVRAAMTDGGDLELEFDSALNTKGAGSLQVFLHETTNGVRVDLDDAGEAATVLWLPWKQGELQTLQPFSIGKAAPNTLFFTYYLSGCKVFAIGGGPVWHIDAPIEAAEFWPQIVSDEWVEENWEPGSEQPVAYLHRAGQQAALWDLSPYLIGGPPSTYGAGNVGQGLVGGVVDDSKRIDLYFKTSSVSPLPASHWVPLECTVHRLKD
ncbi:MAG TPA: BLF1 family deaminating toxin [Longimicrobium sp.]